MTISDAIKLAIENGYKINGLKVKYEPFATGLESVKDSENSYWFFDHLFLDPQFWQSLGKGLGWSMYSEWTGHFNSDEEYLHDFTWRIKWHGLIDHLSANNNIESYFAELK